MPNVESVKFQLIDVPFVRDVTFVDPRRRTADFAQPSFHEFHLGFLPLALPHDGVVSSVFHPSDQLQLFGLLLGELPEKHALNDAKNFVVKCSQFFRHDANGKGPKDQ